MIVALTLTHLKGALDVAHLRRWRVAAIRARSGAFPIDYPDPAAIEALIDAATDALDAFNLATKEESTIELADDVGEFPTLLSDTIDELRKERDSAIDDENEARADLVRVEEERDEAIKERDEQKAIAAVWKERAIRMVRDLRSIEAGSLVWEGVDE